MATFFTSLLAAIVLSVSACSAWAGDRTNNQQQFQFTVPKSATFVGSAQTGEIRYLEVRMPWIMWYEAVVDVSKQELCGAPYESIHLFRANISDGKFAVELLKRHGVDNRHGPRSFFGRPLGRRAYEMEQRSWYGFRLARSGVVTETGRNGASTNYLPEGAVSVPHMDERSLRVVPAWVSSNVAPRSVLGVLDGNESACIFCLDEGTNAFLCLSIVSNTPTLRTYDVNLDPRPERLLAGQRPRVFYSPFLAADVETQTVILVVPSEGKIWRLQFKDADTKSGR